MARILLLIAAIVEFIRGLAGFFACEPIAKLFGLEYIKGALVYAHPLGALMLVFGVMFVIASKDPVKHRFIVDMGILRFGLAFVSHIITIIMVGSLAAFWWVMIVIDLVLFVLFIAFRPKTAAA
jgi:hypothetical protein